MQAASPVLATKGMSVCPSVRYTLALSENDASYRITKSSPTDSPRTLVFGIKNSSRNSKSSPRTRALNESGVGKIRNFQPISRRISETCKIGPKLLLTTNRKFILRPFDWCQNQRPWMTLNGRYVLCCRKDASFGAHHKKSWMKIDPYYQRQKCRPLI